jgi:hypothetical protein
MVRGSSISCSLGPSVWSSVIVLCMVSDVVSGVFFVAFSKFLSGSSTFGTLFCSLLGSPIFPHMF